MARITIVLADDHPVVRQGLGAVLKAEPDFHLIGETGDGLETVDLVKRLRPDILVLDLMMPGLNGLEVTRRVRRCSPQTRVLIFSMYPNEAYVVESLQNGASGYVLKCSSTAELARAVREVAAGRRYLSPPLSERVIEAYAQKVRETSLDAYDTLTAREREVLHLVAEGRTNACIAAQMSISVRTAEVHRANMMRKLSLRSQAEVVLYAVRRGILPME